MRFVAFYLPARRKFFLEVAENLEKACQALARKLGWKTEWAKKDCKIVADFEIQETPAKQEA